MISPETLRKRIANFCAYHRVVEEGDAGTLPQRYTIADAAFTPYLVRLEHLDR